jgi:hypothetical protein
MKLEKRTPRRRSGRSCCDTAWTLLPAGPAQRGPSSSGHRRRGSSRPTSSPSRRSGARRSRSCSSSSSRPGECTWPASARSPPRRGSPEQAGNLAIEERLSGVRFLLRERDARFSGPFDEVLRAEGVRVIGTPIRAPRANAFAERFVRTVRRECLDHVLIYGRRHLERVLGDYVAHYVAERPHRGLSLAVPAGDRTPQVRATTRMPVERRDVLGGLIHEYRWAA